MNLALSNGFVSVTDRFDQAFASHENRLALRWRERQSDVFYEMSYRTLAEKVYHLALGLLSMGVKQQEHVALVADSSPVWTMANLALQKIAAVDVPRGTDSTGDELAYITQHAGARYVFVHYPSEIQKIEKGLEQYDHAVEKYIVLTNRVPPKFAERAITLQSLIEEGQRLSDEKNDLINEIETRKNKIKPEDLVTIVYTSGTTGRPKGVMLSQGNFSFQFDMADQIFRTYKDDRGLTLLPPWHIFGRIVEYNLLMSGGSVTYTDIRHLAHDLREIQPSYLPAVPRIWEGIYNKVFAVLKDAGKDDTFEVYRKYAVRYFFARYRLMGKTRTFVQPPLLKRIGLWWQAIFHVIWYYIPRRLGDLLVFRKVVDATGGQIRLSIAGGAALPGYIDEFFAAIGIPIFEGYGLTETSGVVSLRREDRRIPGTVGPAVDGVEMRLLDENNKDVTNVAGARGTLHVRGPMVMQGYYHDPERTADVLTDDGWFNTGDVVMFTTGGDLCIVGRSKDTVVLAGGENIEPVPIEEKLKECDYIEHVMVVGHDKKQLGVLIVPNERELGDYARQIGIRTTSLAEWNQDSRIIDLFKKEVHERISAANGFKSFERIGPVGLLSKPFEKGDELNNTMKVRRHVVSERYEEEIKELYQ